MKTVLRHTKSDWNELHGEAVFDELLIINTFKHSIESVNQFILKNKSELKAYFEKYNHNAISAYDKKFKETNIHKNLKELLIDKNMVSKLDNICKLMTYLFSGFTKNNLILNDILLTNVPNNQHPQSIMSISITNYWNRLSNGFIDEKELRDQEVIKDLRDYTDDKLKVEVLTKRIMNNTQYGNKVCQFADVMITELDKFTTLISNVNYYILNEYGNKSEPNYFLNSISYTTKKWENNDVYKIWIRGELKKCASTSLYFANMFLSYFGFDNVSLTFDYIDTLKDIWTHDVNKLIDVLTIENFRNELPFLLWYIVHLVYKGNRLSDDRQPYSIVTKKGNGQEYSEFIVNDNLKWLGSILLKLCKKEDNKRILLPQIASLFYGFCDFKPSDLPYSKSDKSCINMFGIDGAKQIMKYFMDFKNYGYYKQDFQNIMTNEMVSWAKNYLERNK